MKISVITSTYNSSFTINQTLNSLKNQTYHDYELIIVDNISSDNTLDKVKLNYIENTLIISEPDQGIYYALNKGIKKASGDIIFILHSNDRIIDDECFEKIIQTFRTTNADVIYGNILIENQVSRKIIRNWISDESQNEKKYFDKNYYKKKIFNGWMPPHTSLFIKKKTINYLGDYNVKYKISSDYDYMIRLFCLDKIRIVYISMHIVAMSFGGESTKFKNIFKKMLEDYNIIKSNNLGGIKVLFKKIVTKLKQLK